MTINAHDLEWSPSYGGDYLGPFAAVGAHIAVLTRGGDTRTGTVVENQRRGMTVQTDNGREWHCPWSAVDRVALMTQEAAE